MQTKEIAHERTNKMSMLVDRFKITAWKDQDGLMRMEILNMDNQEVFHGLNMPWESQAMGGRMAFTSNPYIIELECAAGCDDLRISPEFLREAGKDPVFRAWFMKGSANKMKSPEQRALSIEKIRCQEGRDPATGVLIRVSSNRC